MAFTVKVTMFTLAVVTLTIGTLHNTGGPDTLAQDRLLLFTKKSSFQLTMAAVTMTIPISRGARGLE